MKQTKNLPLTLNIVTALLLAATAFFIYLHAAARTDLSLTLAITFATTTYHFAIRLLTGFVFQHIMKNHADLTRSWYQLRPFEQKLYRILPLCQKLIPAVSMICTIRQSAATRMLLPELVRI